MKKQPRHSLSSATLAALALALSAYGISHAQSSTSASSGSSSSASSPPSGSTTPGSTSAGTMSNSNSNGVIQSGGQSGQPGGSSFGQGAKDATSTAPGNSAFGQSRDETRRNDAAREEERQRISSDIAASTTPAPATPITPATTTDPVTGTTTTPATDNTLSPTGKRSSEMTPTAPPALITAASTLRQAIDANTSFSTYNVAVVPQGDHLVLRGVVSDAAAAQSVLDYAKLKSGSNVKIESEIQIKAK